MIRVAQFNTSKKAKRPAEAATSPGDGSNNPSKDHEMNDETHTTAEAGPATATPASLAELTFDPWVRDETTTEPLSNEEWKDLGKDHLPIVRLAWIAMFSTKARLVEAFVRDQDMTMRLAEDCRRSINFFQSFVTLLEAAEARLLVAASASIDEVAS